MLWEEENLDIPINILQIWGIKYPNRTHFCFIVIDALHDGDEFLLWKVIVEVVNTVVGAVREGEIDNAEILPHNNTNIAVFKMKKSWSFLFWEEYDMISISFKKIAELVGWATGRCCCLFILRQERFNEWQAAVSWNVENGEVVSVVLFLCVLLSSQRTVVAFDNEVNEWMGCVMCLVRAINKTKISLQTNQKPFVPNTTRHTKV